MQFSLTHPNNILNQKIICTGFEIVKQKPEKQTIRTITTFNDYGLHAYIWATCLYMGVSHHFTLISFNGTPSYGGDQIQRLAAAVRKYVDPLNHQFRHPQH